MKEKVQFAPWLADVKKLSDPKTSSLQHSVAPVNPVTATEWVGCLDASRNAKLAASLEPTNSFAGTNHGKWWTNGEERWFVRPSGDDISSSTVLASLFYRSIGVPAAEMRVVMLGGKVCVAAREVPLAKPVTLPLADGHRRDLVAGMAVDALIANRDVVGPSNSNVVAGGDRLFRIDLGGCFRYTGAGKKRDLPGKPDEIDGLRNAGKNSTAHGLFGDISDLEVMEALVALLRLPLDAMMQACRFMRDEPLFHLLMSRRFALLEECRPVLANQSKVSSLDSYKSVIDAAAIREKAAKALDAAKHDLRILVSQLCFIRSGGEYDNQRFSCITTPVDGSIERATSWLAASLPKKVASMSAEDKVAMFLDYMSVGKFNIVASEALVGMISQWAGSSASQGATLLRAIVHKLVGNAEDWTSLEPFDLVPHSSHVVEAMKKDAEKFVRSMCDGIGLQEMVLACKAMLLYNSTILRAIYGREVTLYRGMRGSSVKSYGKSYDFCFEAPASIISSFSSSSGIGSAFGDVVISVSVPVENVLISHVGLPLYGSEREFVVICPRCKYSLMSWEIIRR